MKLMKMLVKTTSLEGGFDDDVNMSNVEGSDKFDIPSIETLHTETNVSGEDVFGHTLLTTDEVNSENSKRGMGTQGTTRA